MMSFSLTNSIKYAHLLIQHTFWHSLQPFGSDIDPYLRYSIEAYSQIRLYIELLWCLSFESIKFQDCFDQDTRKIMASSVKYLLQLWQRLSYIHVWFCQTILNALKNCEYYDLLASSFSASIDCPTTNSWVKTMSRTWIFNIFHTPMFC